MGEIVLEGPLADMAARGRITGEDVLTLRRTVFSDGVVSKAEAEQLFALDRSCPDRSTRWKVFFVEAVTDYVVNQEQPEGYVSQANAAWLMTAISHDDVVDTQTEIELLINVMEKATSSPAELSAFALRQVAHVVVSGIGPLAGGRTAQPGIVTADDVALLKRILYAFGGDGHAGITRQEAEVLFEINDRTVEADNDPSWSDLFVKAVGFSLMGAMLHVPASHDEALRREQWLDDTSVDVAGFFSRVFAGGLRGYAESVTRRGGVEARWRERNDAFDAASARAEAIDAEEADWIANRIGRDGVLHENEKALLRFLREESVNVHPSLSALMNRVA